MSSISIPSVMRFAEEFADEFLASPKEKADEASVNEGLLFIDYVRSYPRLSQLGAALLNMATVNGWTTELDVATGAVKTITPPDKPYVAPARQSPTDFNLHSA